MRTLQWHQGPVRAVAYSPDGALLASGGNDGDIRLGRLTGPGKPHVLEGHGDWVRGLAFAPNGKTLASAGWDNKVRVWSRAARSLKAEYVNQQGGAWSVAYSPTSADLASGTGDGTVFFLRRGEQHALSRREHRAPVVAMAFTLDGSRLVTASRDGTVKLWDAGWCQFLGTVQNRSEWLHSLAVSRDGRLVAAGDYQGVVLVSSLPEGEDVWRLRGHVGPLAGVSFTPCGRRLLTVGWEGTARLWDVASGREESAFAWGAGKLHCLAVAPDGMTAAAGAEDGSVVVWDLEE